MRAVRFHEFGGPDVLKVEEVDAPKPGSGEVLVKVAGTSYNPLDSVLRSGVFPIKLDLPMTTALDVSGTIAELGDGVEGWSVGDAVVGYLPLTGTGGAAEYTLAPASILAEAPTSLSLRDAAALPLVGLTAWQGLIEHAGLRSGMTVLVQGAGGGVGRAVIQIAKAHGARVIAITDEATRDQATVDGADVVLGRSALNSAVSEQLDIAINLAPAGVANLERLLPDIDPAGGLISMTAPVPEQGPAGLKMLRMGSRSDAQQLAQVVSLVNTGKLDPHVAEVIGLADVRALHEDPRPRGGKVVIDVTR